MPVLNANIKALNLHVKSPKFHKLYFVVQTFLYICFYQTVHKTNASFLFHFLIHTHSTNILPSAY